jgi:hypothetical protein
VRASRRHSSSRQGVPQSIRHAVEFAWWSGIFGSS